MRERWRLFVAIEPGVEARQALRLAQAAARHVGFSARWVNPASAHLTLKFLGDTDPTHIESLGVALGAVAARNPSFTLHTTTLGGFPNLRHPRVLWLGLGGVLDQLTALQQAVEKALAAQDFPAEDRPFTPHLTLGRLDRETVLPAPAAVAALTARADFAGTGLSVRRIQLIRSVLARGGASYTTLYDLPLVGGDE